MQFLTIASLFAAAALAAPMPQTPDCPNPAHCGTAPPDPSTYENIDISDYILRKNNGIQSISFKLSSGATTTDISCSISAVPSIPSDVVTCGTSAYRFGVVANPNGGSEPGIAIYHQTSPFAGKWGTGAVATYCRAGGAGPDDFVCQQKNPTTIVIQ
ncbi:hypothetical protein ACN47E_000536 [Coniothyrium glycines]